MVDKKNLSLLTEEELKFITNLVSMRRSYCVSSSNNDAISTFKPIFGKTPQEEVEIYDSILCKMLYAGNYEKFVWFANEIELMHKVIKQAHRESF